MFAPVTRSAIYLADLTDPTSDGMLTKIVNYGLGALMVLVAIFGGWFAFSVWLEKKGKKEAIVEIRHIALGVIVVEAFLGAVIAIANYGSGLGNGFV
ncbi:hypothetical protein [Mycolicibacterium aubagnense]|uniref:Integral membrane protein n=1 Tax=Mycolicibacterium aubagnense TaxID=319707 RepID=A0ABN5Z155_9MYCO|nr:hypothetical protein [Mycolicibacterium aubagnense]TLH64241.1 hypothetical protein C1S80_12570 [Mycolicibacterium aubagnense]BBX87880.1 hypothetical protein MAUB_57530 [Mycolicibacterium aubagnense]